MQDPSPRNRPTSKQRIAALFGNSGFRGPILKLLSGTGITFVIGYLSKPVLLRIYPSEAIGIWGFIIAVVGVVTPLASMRYDDALMLPENPRTAAHAFLLSWTSVIAVCALLFLVTPFKTSVASFFGKESAAMWAWVIPIVLLVNRGAKITEVWLSRHEEFTRISAGQVIQTSGMVGTRVGAGLLKAGAGGYIGGFITGYALTLVSYSGRTLSSLRSALGSPPSWSEIREVAIRYRRFPMFTMPAAIVSALIMRLPMILIFTNFDESTAGLYSEAFNNLLVPLSLVAAAVAQVYYVRAVEARRIGSLAQITDKVHRKLVLLGLFPIACLMISGPDVFDFLFGARSNWRMAGGFIVYIGPLILFSIIASPLTRLFDVLERQRLEFLTAAVMLAVLGAALLHARDSKDIHAFLFWLGMAGTTVRLFQLGIILRLARVPWKRIAAPYVRYIALSAPLLAVVYLVTRIGSPIAVTVATAMAFAVFGLYAVAYERLLAHRPDDSDIVSS